MVKYILRALECLRVVINTLNGKNLKQDLLVLVNLYLKELRELDNDTQRYIVFCWMIGCHLWKWNESIFEHEISEPFCYINETDWNRASDAIMTLVSCGLG